MYSPVRLSVNGPEMRTGVFLVVCVVLGLTAFQATPPLSCDAVLTTLFTPARPQLGRYEVCTTREPLTAVARPRWRIETLPPLDAFGAAGPYDRAALSRLYGGRRVGVARGWTEEGNRFESLTLISPYPDATLSRLMPGTLVIRHAIIR